RICCSVWNFPTPQVSIMCRRTWVKYGSTDMTWSFPRGTYKQMHFPGIPSLLGASSKTKCWNYPITVGTGIGSAVLHWMMVLHSAGPPKGSRCTGTMDSWWITFSKIRSRQQTQDTMSERGVGILQTGRISGDVRFRATMNGWIAMEMDGLPIRTNSIWA